MQLPFFYECDLTQTDKHFTLSNDTFKHAIQVLRLKNGDYLHLTNGNGLLATAQLQEVNKKEATVFIQSCTVAPKSLNNVTIAISLVKNSARFEWFLEKVSELGINQIIPLICKRTEKQHFRLDRMKGITISAMLQSRQCWLPQLVEPTLLQTVVMQQYQHKYVAHCLQGEKNTLKSSQESTLIFIGPEGDFTEEEIEWCLQQNCVAVTLGNTRLRTETAGIVAASILMNN